MPCSENERQMMIKKPLPPPTCAEHRSLLHIFSSGGGRMQLVAPSASGPEAQQQLQSSASFDVERGCSDAFPLHSNYYYPLLRPYRSRDPPPLSENLVFPAAARSIPKRHNPVFASPLPPPAVTESTAVSYGFCRRFDQTDAGCLPVAPGRRSLDGRRFPGRRGGGGSRRSPVVEEERVVEKRRSPPAPAPFFQHRRPPDLKQAPLRSPVSDKPPRHSGGEPVERLAVISSGDRAGQAVMSTETKKKWKKKSAHVQMWRPLNKSPVAFPSFGPNDAGGRSERFPRRAASSSSSSADAPHIMLQQQQQDEAAKHKENKELEEEYRHNLHIHRSAMAPPSRFSRGRRRVNPSDQEVMLDIKPAEGDAVVVVGDDPAGSRISHGAPAAAAAAAAAGALAPRRDGGAGSAAESVARKLLPPPNDAKMPAEKEAEAAMSDVVTYSNFKAVSATPELELARLPAAGRGRDVQASNGTSYRWRPCVDEPPINAERYFAALQGPELDVLRESEVSVLPVDEKWPFLLRFPIGCFGICLGLASQSILWKALASQPYAWIRTANPLLPVLNFVLWIMALAAILCVSGTYALKCVYFPEAVRREFQHPVRNNFFFAPWIAGMFLALGLPPSIATSLHPAVWLLFMAPIFALELKIYGQWLSGGRRRLSEVANPSTQLSLMANFVGALFAATVNWREPAIFAWAVGLAHFVVLFVTLYQRLPTAAVIPKELHPVFFLFVAAPSNASVAWAKIVGDFDLIARINYFIGLFLYCCLVVPINFFRGFRFSVAWWAYTTPMTSAAIATIHYSVKVRNPLTEALTLLLSCVSSVTVLAMCLLTFLHIFYWKNLFPNDAAIALTKERKQQEQQHPADGS